MPSRKFSDPLTAQDQQTAHQYFGFLMNDPISYNNQRKHQYKNLGKKYDKGIYDEEKGVKMFLHLTNANKSRFNNGILYPNIRFRTAQLLEDDFINNREEYLNNL